MAVRLAAHLVVERAAPALRDACLDPSVVWFLPAIHGDGMTVAGVCDASGRPEPEVRKALHDLGLAGATAAFVRDGATVHRLGRDAEILL